MKKTYYLDMDGFLVKYDINAYAGENPLYLRKNEHYFRHLEPDRKALEFVDRLHARCRYTGDEMFILTSININGAIFNEHFHDKIYWNHIWLPYIDIDHILISVTTKRDAVEYIHNHKLTENDILIDDYNKNLFDWKASGGTSVKYCNGINNPSSFSGPKLFSTDSVDKMMEDINRIATMTEKGNIR